MTKAAKAKEKLAPKEEENTFQEEGKLIVSCEAPRRAFPMFYEDILEGTFMGGRFKGKKFHIGLGVNGAALYLMIQDEELRSLPLRPVMEAWLELANDPQKRIVTAALPVRKAKKSKPAA